MLLFSRRDIGKERLTRLALHLWELVTPFVTDSTSVAQEEKLPQCNCILNLRISPQRHASTTSQKLSLSRGQKTPHSIIPKQSLFLVPEKIVFAKTYSLKIGLLQGVTSCWKSAHRISGYHEKIATFKF